MKSSQVKKKIIIHSECIIDFRGRLSLSTMMYNILCPYRQGRFYIYYITQAKMENRKHREAIYLIFSFLWFDLAIYKIKCLLYSDKR